MKKIVLLLGLIIGSFGSINAQRVPQATPTPLVEDATRQEGLRRQDDVNRRSEALRNAEKFPVKEDKDSKIYQQYIKPLYRDLTKEEENLMAADDEDLKTFAGFLSQSNTGLTKLIADKNCDENEKVANVSPNCQKYTMPGAGASFSFRTNNYRIRHLADLNYTGRNFRAFGVLNHGIFVNLGDIPLEKIDLQTEAVKKLMSFEPAKDFKQAQEFAVQLDKGIESNGFVYRNILPASENSTYVLRSIAYKGSLIRTIGGISYDELEFDKRKDIIIAFRVVRRDSDGNVTILWKELSNKNSPKLKEK